MFGRPPLHPSESTPGLPTIPSFEGRLQNQLFENSKLKNGNTNIKLHVQFLFSCKFMVVCFRHFCCFRCICKA